MTEDTVYLGSRGESQIAELDELLDEPGKALVSGSILGHHVLTTRT